MRPRIVAIAAAVVAVIGCGQPVPVQFKDRPGDAEVVDEAFAILGIEYETTNRTRGTIHIALVDDYSEEAATGIRVLDARCYKAIVAERLPQTLAHELGHALGLGHCDEACEPANLMYSPSFGVGLTDDQLDDLDRGRRRITGCR